MLQNIENKLNMNLQLLAGEGEEGTEANSGQGEGAIEQTQNNNEGSEGNQENTITMTQEQLNSMFDKKYAQWKKNQKKKYKKKLRKLKKLRS